MIYSEILQFWFSEESEARWWVKDKLFDQHIKERFLSVHQRATACELYSWRESIEGRLAEIIVLDQFSRNIFRDTPQAFAQDALALGLAQEAVSLVESLPDKHMHFMLMPYMHSESKEIHKEAMRLFTKYGLEEPLKFELQHKLIIDRFGRYPHRNDILGRESTSEEIQFLKEPGSSF